VGFAIAGITAVYVGAVLTALFVHRHDPERRTNVVVLGLLAPLALVVVIGGLVGLWVLLLARGAD
jgi:hypothetical protein